MPTAFLSDIHGNLPALEAIEAHARAQGCDAFVNLGDIVSGPLWPSETLDFLMQRDWATIRGNHERQLVDQAPEAMSESDRYARERLDDRQMAWIEALPATLELSSDIFLCHGIPTSDLRYFMEHVEPNGIRAATAQEVEGRASTVPHQLIWCGHTHIQRLVELPGGRRVANPGSAGLPAFESDRPYPHFIESGSPAVRYAILDGNEIRFFSVAYDHEAAARQAERNERPDWVQALRYGHMGRA